LLPGPFTTATVQELFIDGTVPTRRDDLHVAVDVDSATGLRWQDGCAGPMVTRGYLDFSRAEPGFPQWQPYTRDWAARASRGSGTGKTIEPGKVVRTSYFYGGRFFPFGRTWGGAFVPAGTCEPPPVCPTVDPGGGPPAFPPGLGATLPPALDPACATPEPAGSSGPGGPPGQTPTPRPTSRSP
jgi:hypothetical protein